ncbi:MAG: AMP-binding protein, partial [Bacteroidota bacterium]
MHKLSYLSGTSHTPLIGSTIGDYFDHIVSRFPQNDALIVAQQNIHWTYQELSEKVQETARAFLALGLQKGDRIGIWAPNQSEWLLTQLATAKLGAILVNINPSYRAQELKYALNQSGCRMLVMADQFKSANFTEIIQSLAPELANCPPGALNSQELPDLQTIIRLHPETLPGMWTWENFILQANQTSEEEIAQIQSGLSFDEAINIQYTSGMTGYPKGATLSHHNILNNGYFVARSMHFTEKDRLIIPVPLYHCFGMVMGNLGCITHGATMIYPSEAFEPEKVLQAAQAYQATALYGVPTMFIAELEHP